jgi:hypothetical protein
MGCAGLGKDNIVNLPYWRLAEVSSYSTCYGTVGEVRQEIVLGGQRCHVTRTTKEGR